jgi:hypothetical protein
MGAPTYARMDAQGYKKTASEAWASQSGVGLVKGSLKGQKNDCDKNRNSDRIGTTFHLKNLE